jgi:hypothetical protein
MASKVEVLLVDDVDGGKADETVTFALDGTNYEIDLASDKAGQLREQLGTFIGHARKIGRSGAVRGRRSSSAGSNPQADVTAVRQWARENGYEVSDRGRVAANVLQAYSEAH